ncbi:hypothetical protein IZU87_16820 [Cobetia sp. MC34]|nr:hypothetical protein [Cobetia sp. MC34]
MMFKLQKGKTSIDEEILMQLVKSQPRKSHTIRAHAQRAARSRQLIENRFGIKHPKQWKAKHVRWLMKDGLGNISPATAYDYWRTCCWILKELGVFQDWQPYLRGPWLNPKGIYPG